MKYYFLKNSSKIEEIEGFPQCETSVIPGKLNDLNLDEPSTNLSSEIFPVPFYITNPR